MAISILLVDDHAIFRKGLQELLGYYPDFQVVGEAADGLEGVAMAESLNPDVMVVDMMMPGLNGLEVTVRIKQNQPTIQIIILSLHDDKVYVVNALSSGASGYVLKDHMAEDLPGAVKTVMAGGQFLSAPVEKYKDV